MEGATYALDECECDDEFECDELAQGVVLRHAGLEGHGDEEDRHECQELRDVADDLDLTS